MTATISRVRLLAAVSCFLLLASSANAAEGNAEQKGANVSSAESSAAVKSSAAAKQVADWSLAHSLAKYGRDHNSPEALITAAEILAGIQTDELKAEPKIEKSPGAKQGTTAKKPNAPPDDSPKALLDEARKMAKGDEALLAMADRAADRLDDKPRGADPRPAEDSDWLAPGEMVTYTITFRGLEDAIVGVKGSGNADLDLYVTDENLNPVAVDDDDTDLCLAEWVPLVTGKFFASSDKSVGEFWLGEGAKVVI